MSARSRPYVAAAAPLLLLATLVGACNKGPSVAPSACVTGSAAPVNNGTFDLTVSKILVSQAIQTPTNSVPLVAQRGTVVRVMLGTGAPNKSVSGVTGTLSVKVGATAVSLGSHSAPLNGSILAPGAPSWVNECDTLNFEIPAPTGITAGNVTFHVDINTFPEESNGANNSGEVALAVSDRATPLLHYTSVNFNNIGLPDDSFIASGRGDSFVRGIYPVNDADSTLYRKASFPALAWPDANGNGILDGGGAEGDGLIIQLQQCRQLLIAGGVGPSNRVFLYGWIKGSVGGNGLGEVNGHVGFGNTEEVRGQRSYAHELGHNFGFSHDMAAIDEIGWDVGGRLAAGPAGNNVAPDGRIKPTSLYDIMVPGLMTNGAWIKSAHYIDLFNNPILASAPDKDLSRDNVVIQGSIDPSGIKLTNRLAVFRYPWPLPPPPPPESQKGRYEVVVTNAAGQQARARFDGFVDTPEMQLRRGAFEVSVKLAGDLASLRIVDTETQTVLVERKSAGLPTIKLTSPASGQQLGERTEVAWDATFAAQIGDVQYQIAYSPDNGQTFVPLAVGIPGETTKLNVNTREIAKSDGLGLIRVFVSDGLNTAFADVGKLTPTAAIY